MVLRRWVWRPSSAILETVELLLDNGAKVNVSFRNFLKAVPLRSASVAGHLEIARLLILRGADINALGEGGETPLHEVAAWVY